MDNPDKELRMSEAAAPSSCERTPSARPGRSVSRSCSSSSPPGSTGCTGLKPRGDARYSGDGVGGLLGLVIWILASFVTFFLVPSEVGKLFSRDGQQPPSRVRRTLAPAPARGWDRLVREGAGRAEPALEQQDRVGLRQDGAGLLGSRSVRASVAILRVCKRSSPSSRTRTCRAARARCRPPVSPRSSGRTSSSTQVTS